MGLNIQPGGASWAYSGFNAFRRRLAAAEGIDLAEMEGFGGEKPWDSPSGNPITPLKHLLYHSDCDGHLDAWQCEEMLPRLKAIFRSWPDTFEFDYDKDQAALLIAGMQHSVEHGCAVAFR